MWDAGGKTGRAARRVLPYEGGNVGERTAIMATIDTVKEVLEENLDINPESVNDDSTFDSLGIDSLDMVELICDLEEKCDVDFWRAEGLKTVGELVEYIDSL